MRPLEERDLHKSALARRLAVHEFRNHLGPASDWRLRMVDHHTEPLVNGTIWSSCKLKNNYDFLLTVWMFCSAGIRVAMSKSEISKAYRKLPIMEDHTCFATTIFLLNGVAMISHHHALGFGATSSCWGWLKAGGLIQCILKTFFRIPILRYVDDYLSAGRWGVRLDMS